MKRIALITKYSWVNISTSVINTALYWADKGYIVDVFLERPDDKRFTPLNFGNRSINIVRSSILARFRLDDLLFYLNYFNRNVDYEWVIGFDIDGLIRAGICQFFGGFEVIYHSLEFYEPQAKTPRALVIKWMERHFSSKASYVFTQDALRCEFLHRDLRIGKDKFKIIYNSPNGNTIRSRHNYFRKLFDIPDNLLVVLCVGSLIKEHYVYNLVDSVSTWMKNFTLVLHGWFPDDKVKRYVLEQQKLLPEMIHISDELFDNENKYVPFQSCDIGFVGFLPVSKNMEYSAGSAGKLFDFLRTGKPIVAFNTPGMFELIEGNGVGFVFNEPGEIACLLLKIKDNYEILSQNCYDTYKTYEFNCQYERIFATI